MSTRKTHDHNAKKDFTSVVKNENPITDYVIGHYYTRGKRHAVEVSYGKFLESEIYGVTVVDIVTQTHDHELSKAFKTEVEAMNYIASL